MIQATHITKSYNHSLNKVSVLKGIDLSINEGEVLAVVGPSGAGKSTLLHILGGLDSPDSGQVMMDGENIYQMNDRHRARLRNQKIGFIFQFYHLLPEFSALENVILPALVKNPDDRLKTWETKGMELLARMGLGQRQRHKPSELSGGEQQRVAIARALINDPKVIYCDEPTGNLDSETGKAIIQLLLELNKKNRQTLVIVTHDENIASRADKTIQLKDGQIVR